MTFHPICRMLAPTRVCRRAWNRADLGFAFCVAAGLLLLFHPGPGTALEAPVLLDYAFEDSVSDGSAHSLRNGDTLILRTVWAVPDSADSVASVGLADSLKVTADFSHLETGASGPTFVEPLGEGRYRIIHQIPVTNTRPDSERIEIPVQAVLFDTLRTTDRRVHVCLSNHRPRHLGTELVDPRPVPYHVGDSLFIRTHWISESGLPLKVHADFSNIVVDTAAASPPRISLQGEGTFLIRFRIPLDVADLQPGGPDKIIPIIGGEIGGCGTTEVRSISVDLDTEPPPLDQLSLDPMPSVTTSDSLLVSGRAGGAYVVVILRDLFGVARVNPDTTGRYRKVIPLALGLNKIQVRAEDEAGNTTSFFPTEAVPVTRVEGAELHVGAPFSRKDKKGDPEDDIVLRDPAGMESITVRIFNLEGDCVFEDVVPGPQSEFAFHWTGEDRSGRRVPQGYYLVRARWSSGSGGAKDLVRGLLLKD